MTLRGDKNGRVTKKALFKTVAQDSLVIPIFRDFMLNIHVEVLLAPEAG